MALQGNLRDFASTEILQLIGTQRKSGCLTLEWNTERASIWVVDGRIVSTRQPGMAKDDPFLAFLRRTKRLSEEQYRGILTIQRESNRDLEDLLLNGRYMDAQELAMYLERQILDDLQRVVRWDNGSYRFDPNAKWPHPPVASLSMEGALIEASRRMDEQRRFVSMFKDPHQLLGVRDLPDPEEPLSDEERDLFGIIDGQHTIAEIVEAAPLSEYEVYEALQRMHDSNWIEFVGRRLPGQLPPAAPVEQNRAARPPRRLLQEATVLLVIVAATFGLRYASARIPIGRVASPTNDVFASAQMRDVRYALELYHRELGTYPHRLQELVEDRWIARDQVRLPGYVVVYRAEAGGQSYRLETRPDR
jgi:hypothetical protein